MALPAPLDPDAPLSLALAVVASSSAPLVLLDGDLTVIAASMSFCVAFQLDPGQVPDRKLSELGSGEWGSLKLASLLRATGSGFAKVEAYEMDLVRPGREPRQLVLNAQKLAYGDNEHTRLLLSVSDVTDARNSDKVKDDLVREKAMLLQEVQHRIANSLQIIASVLMQSARRVQSAETRGHLQDAHSRVMSIAAVQRQLVVSKVGEVELRTYFNQLCDSLGASMIENHDQLSVEVSADDSVTSPDASVSLGLIVTELVINALKHAFPHNRQGKIKVDYRSDGKAWTLSVKDNGVGIHADPAANKPGLGTSIVAALAAQLHAVVSMTDAQPGTMVSIVHA